MKTNTRQRHRTYEGAPATIPNAREQLRRAVLSCMLWEKEFYESGESIASRIVKLCSQVDPAFIADLAYEARQVHNIRHASLWLLVQLIKHGKGKVVENAIARTIARADELAELVALYWKDGRKPLSNPMKKGLARAFLKFDAYQLAKYSRRDAAVKLRDVMFLVHPKPSYDRQADTFTQLAEGTLPVPGTWESRLTSGENKREVFEDLMKRNKLGDLALLRNLRGMLQAGVSEETIKRYMATRRFNRVLPFRFLAAARSAPSLEPMIDAAMIQSLEMAPRLAGRTILLVDVSGSMGDRISAKSDLTRRDAACALGILLVGICESLRVFSFSGKVVEVPPRKGMALVDAIVNSQCNGATYLGKAVRSVMHHAYDRLIVITDDQSHDAVPSPSGRAYKINVASYEKGVGYGSWTNIHGFSESVVDFIRELEHTKA